MGGKTGATIHRYDKESVDLYRKAKGMFVQDFDQTGVNCKAGLWSLVWNFTEVAAESVELLNPSTQYRSCVKHT